MQITKSSGNAGWIPLAFFSYNTNIQLSALSAGLDSLLARLRKSNLETVLLGPDDKGSKK